MKKLDSENIRNIILVILLLAVLGLLALFVIKRQPIDTSKHIADNNQMTKNITKSHDIQLIDVRTAEEYQAEHASGAVNIPVEKISAGEIDGISKSLPIYLYCRTGNRASTAKKLLEEAGFTNVTNLGGLSDWQKSGGKVCSTEAIECV